MVTMPGGHAMTALTATTAQNTLGVTGVWPLPLGAVIAQIDAVAADLGIDVVTIGMIGSAGRLTDGPRYRPYPSAASRR